MNDEPTSGASRRRKLLWWAFWLVLIATPLWALFARWTGSAISSRLFDPVAAAFVSIVFGPIVAGFILSVLRSKPGEGFVLDGIVFGTVLMILSLLLFGRFLEQ